MIPHVQRERPPLHEEVSDEARAAAGDGAALPIAHDSAPAQTQ